MNPEDIFNATLILDDNLQAMLRIGSFCFLGLNLTSEPDQHTNIVIGTTLLTILAGSLMLKCYQKGYEHGLRDNPEELLATAEHLHQQVQDLRDELESRETIRNILSKIDNQQDEDVKPTTRPGW